MKKPIIHFAMHSVLLTSAIAGTTTNQTIVFTRDTPNKARLEIVRESSPLSSPPPEIRSGERMVILGGKTVLSSFGEVSFIGPDRADTFFVATHTNGQTNLHPERMLKKPHYPDRVEIVFHDLLQESNATVYLYQEQQQIWAIGSSLVVTIISSGSASGSTNVTTQESVLWTPAAGNPYHPNSAKLTGSLEAGNLAVEVTTSISGNGGKKQVHRFLNGKWEFDEKKSTP